MNLKQPEKSCIYSVHDPLSKTMFVLPSSKHYYADNEGKGGQIRNPIISTILYLTTDEDEDDHDDDNKNGANSRCGGPSLITNQRLQSTW